MATSTTAVVYATPRSPQQHTHHLCTRYGLRILQHCCCSCQLLSWPTGHHTPQARRHRARPAPLPKLIANELLLLKKSTPSVHLSAKSMPTRTKRHWDPRAEHPLCTLCYLEYFQRLVSKMPSQALENYLSFFFPGPSNKKMLHFE